jgi:hypothetical protein
VALVVLGARAPGRFAGIGPVVGRLTAHPVGRGALVVGWMWLGWHAFAR